MRKQGPESPADSNLIEFKAGLSEGMVEGLGRGEGGGAVGTVGSAGFGRERGRHEVVLASQWELAAGVGRATGQGLEAW